MVGLPWTTMHTRPPPPPPTPTPNVKIDGRDPDGWKRIENKETDPRECEEQHNQGRPVPTRRTYHDNHPKQPTRTQEWKWNRSPSDHHRHRLGRWCLSSNEPWDPIARPKGPVQPVQQLMHPADRLERWWVHETKRWYAHRHDNHSLPGVQSPP